MPDVSRVSVHFHDFMTEPYWLLLEPSDLDQRTRWCVWNRCRHTISDSISKAMPFHAFLEVLSCPRVVFRSHWEGTSKAFFSGQRYIPASSAGVAGILGGNRKRTYATIADEPVRNAPSSNPFPYPSNPSPSAHQIFHLKSGATPAQIKARCE